MGVLNTIVSATSKLTSVGKIEPIDSEDLLWTVELEKGEELWIEAQYIDGPTIKGRVRYNGKMLRPTNTYSGEFVEIPEFVAVGPNNPLLAGPVLKYRLFRN